MKWQGQAWRDDLLARIYDAGGSSVSGAPRTIDHLGREPEPGERRQIRNGHRSAVTVFHPVNVAAATRSVNETEPLRSTSPPDPPHGTRIEFVRARRARPAAADPADLRLIRPMTRSAARRFGSLPSDDAHGFSGRRL